MISIESPFVQMLWLLLLCDSLAVARGGEANLRVDPETVGVRLFYSGAKVHVEGSAPRGWEVAFVCTGKEGRVHLKKKGKVGGVLWMNTGEVEIDHVPSLYLLATSRSLEKAGCLASFKELGVGRGALQSGAVIRPGGEDETRIFDEFIKLKEKEGLYSFAEGALKREPGGDGTLGCSADFFLPAKVPEGEYEVRLYGFHDGTGRLMGTRTLTVEQAGIAAWIKSTAQERGLLYGILSVVIALAAGLVTGVLFNLGPRGGH